MQASPGLEFLIQAGFHNLAADSSLFMLWVGIQLCLQASDTAKTADALNKRAGTSTLKSKCVTGYDAWDSGPGLWWSLSFILLCNMQDNKVAEESVLLSSALCSLHQVLQT
jgi:hypothetical protein